MPDNSSFSEAKPEKTSLRATIRWLAGLALFAWVLRSLVVAPFSIPSGSMLPTMAIGDYLFVAKWPYGFSRFSFPGRIPSFSGRVFDRLPERGDVVIFKRPDAVGADWVKRVIGLPGDTVAMRGGVLILNGRPVPKQKAGIVRIAITPNSPCHLPTATSSCLYPSYRETLPNGRSYLTIDQLAGGPGDDFAPVTITAGKLFLMGDNRDDSLDSRFSLEQGGVGLVPTDRLVGRAAFAFWSTDGSSSYWKPWTWISALRFNRIGTSYQP
ncbi:MAG: signal peptidase I [Sphingomonas bacterium]|nr:signal peptidase I [Sphingomonas bacterium]